MEEFKSTVTIPLKELDDLRDKIKNLENKLAEYKVRLDVRLSIVGQVSELDYIELNNEIKTFIEESLYIRFYRKFPRWFHKLFKCDK